MKHVEKDSKECVVRSVVLSKYLTDDGQDRFVPLLDTFDDPINNAMCYHVVPFLRKMYEPPFEIVSEVIDFVDQVLEVYPLYAFTLPKKS